MNTIICEDDALYRAALREEIKNWIAERDKAAAINVFEFSSTEDLLEAWENGLKLDIIFLDIEIPNNMSGMEIAKHIFEVDKNVQFVFVTNYPSFATEGYLVNALRYLIKPASQKEISECMDIVWNRWSMVADECILAKTKTTTVVVPLKELVSIEAVGRFCKLTLCTQKETFLIREKLGSITKKVPANLFIQCHRSYWVNLMFVRQIRYTSLTLADQSIIPVGRKYASVCRQEFERYYQGVRTIEYYT